MVDEQADPRQEGCGVFNLIIPVFLIGGGVLGWCLGRPFGALWGVLGVGAGLFLAVPATGLLLLSLVGILSLVERLGRGPVDSVAETPPPDRPDVP